MQIEIIDNSGLVEEVLQEALERALTQCGLDAERRAKKLCPTDTGLLKNSITFALSGQEAKEKEYKADKPDKSGEVKKGMYEGTVPKESDHETSVYIGTNVEYGVYQEMGTGKNYDGGRPTKWTYEDAKGQFHMTGGNTANPFLKPAVADHASDYLKTIEDALKGT